jgi:excisionase family DNA binding protein
MPKLVERKSGEATILTVHEVAEYLRVSDAKVYKLVKKGKLPGLRIGRAWRFRKDLLDQWISQAMELSVRIEV